MDKGGGPAGNRKREVHGMDTLVQRGEAALDTPEKLSRYAELKRQFESEPGRVEYRQELAALLAMICENGFNKLRVDAEAGRDIWTTPGPLKMLGVYVNSLSRLLDSWPKDGKQRDLSNVIENLSRGNDEANNQG